MLFSSNPFKSSSLLLKFRFSSKVASKLVFTPLSSVKFKIILSPALALNTSSLLTLPLTTYFPSSVFVMLNLLGSRSTLTTSVVVLVFKLPLHFTFWVTWGGKYIFTGTLIAPWEAVVPILKELFEFTVKPLFTGVPVLR